MYHTWIEIKLSTEVQSILLRSLMIEGGGVMISISYTTKPCDQCSSFIRLIIYRMTEKINNVPALISFRSSAVQIEN